MKLIQKTLSLLLCIMLVVPAFIEAVKAELVYPEITKVEINTKTVKTGEKLSVSVFGSDDYAVNDPEKWNRVQLSRVGDAEDYPRYIDIPLKKKASGHYVAELIIDDSYYSGEYIIFSVDVMNKDGCNANFSYGDDPAIPIPHETISISTAIKDSKPPKVSSANAKSGTFHEGDTIRIAAAASDQSGISYGEACLSRDTKPNEEDIMKFESMYDVDSNGIYVAEFKIDSTWPSGTYHLSEIRFTDSLENSGSFSEIIGYDDKFNPIPNELFPNATFEVLTSWTDTKKPSITKVVANSQIVRAGESFSVLVNAEDESGLNDKEKGYAWIHKVSGEDQRGINAYLVKQADGSMKATFQTDETWELCDYCLGGVVVYDNFGNVESVGADYYAGDPDCPGAYYTLVSKNTDTSKLTPKEAPVYTDPEENSGDNQSDKDKTGEINENTSRVVTKAEVDKVVEKYTDIPEQTTWYTEGVSYAVTKGYMTGTSNSSFEPNGHVTRAQIAQILYAAEGKPISYGDASFKDVGSGKWYSNAVIWAANCGIVSGYPDKTFRPNEKITREQMVAIMYKYTQMKGYNDALNGDLSKFSDYSKISNYAIPGMKWAVGHRVISGTKVGIEPKGFATRAQVAVILQSYDKNIRK